MRPWSHLLELLRIVNRGDLEFDAGVDVLVDVKIGDPALHDFPQSHRVRLSGWWSIRMIVLLVARLLASVTSLLLSVAVALRWLRVVYNSHRVDFLPVARAEACAR